MNSQIDYAAATGKISVIKPGLIRAICIVEHQIDSVDVTEIAIAAERMDLLNALNKTI